MIEIEKEKQYLWPLNMAKENISSFCYEIIAKGTIDFLIVNF